MPFQKVEFSFPHEEETSTDIEIEGSSAIEIDLSGNPQTEPEPEPVVLLNHQRKLLMRSLKSTLIKYGTESVILARVTMTNVGLKKQRYVNGKNLKEWLNSLLTKIKDLKVQSIRTKKPF
jgi:hypothetical protein